MILLRSCEVFTPEAIGIKDVLVAGTNIVAISDKINMGLMSGLVELQCQGLLLTPGLIDAHVHIAGAGGEGGPATRTPEMQLSHMLEAGVTTVVGCQGTDGVTRRLEGLLMKVKALRQEGVSAYMVTGSYQVPVPTLLGDIAKDIALIEEVIGVGEIALSDHRSSCPTTDELTRIASQARIGGMLGGKGGIVIIHMGDAQNPFEPLYAVANSSELRLTQFLPTHCNRNRHILSCAKEYGLKGYVDITTASYPYFPDEELKPSRAVAELLKGGVPLEHITMSSDGFGSLPRFGTDGSLLQLEMGYPKSLLNEVRDCILLEGMPPDRALAPATSNVARIFGLKNKGQIKIGNAADLAVFDPHFKLVHLIANGNLMVADGKPLKKGTYEK